MKSTHINSRRALRSLAVITVFGTLIAACGSDSDSADAPSTVDSSTAGTDGMTVQFVNPLPTFPTWKLLGECMQDQAEIRGVDLTDSGPTGTGGLDPAAMIQQVQQAVANKVDGVVTFPASDGFAEVLKQAQDAGIVTGTFYGPGGPESGSDVNAGPDWAAIGKTTVDAVAAQPGDHVIGLVASGGTGLGKLWMDGVKEAVATYDNVTIAGEVFTGDDAAQALPQVSALLTAHPEVTEIVTHMGTITPGAVAAIKAQGLEGKTFLVVVGHDNGGTEAIAEGTATIMLMQGICPLGRAMLNAVVDIHEGKQPSEVPVLVEAVSGADVQRFLDDGWE